MRAWGAHFRASVRVRSGIADPAHTIDVSCPPSRPVAMPRAAISSRTVGTNTSRLTRWSSIAFKAAFGLNRGNATKVEPAWIDSPNAYKFMLAASGPGASVTLSGTNWKYFALLTKDSRHESVVRTKAFGNPLVPEERPSRNGCAPASSMDAHVCAASVN